MIEKRLIQIKEKTSFVGDIVEYLEKEDYEWLVEQTEKMQKVEFEVNNSDMSAGVSNIIEIVEG